MDTPTVSTRNTTTITKVADLISENKTWKISLIWNTFSRINASKILASHIPKGDEEDALEWKLSQGTFQQSQTIGFSTRGQLPHTQKHNSENQFGIQTSSSKVETLPMKNCSQSHPNNIQFS